MHFLSVCAVVLDEALYLEEWMCWHLLQGVEHFYLYDNGSTDGTKEIYERYKDVVTWYDFKDVNPVQFKAYQHCIENHRKDTEWCAFLDCDEFLCTILNSLPKAIKSFKPDEKKIGAIVAHWVYFGANGRKEKTEGLVIERFTRSQRGANWHVKSIVNMAWAISVGKDPHSFYTHGIVVDEKDMVLEKDYALSEPATSDFIWINHFHTKSYEEYKIRKKRPDPGTGVIHSPERVEEMFKAHDINATEDSWAKDKAMAVKMLMLERSHRNHAGLS